MGVSTEQHIPSPAPQSALLQLSSSAPAQGWNRFPIRRAVFPECALGLHRYCGDNRFSRNTRGGLVCEQNLYELQLQKQTNLHLASSSSSEEREGPSSASKTEAPTASLLDNSVRTQSKDVAVIDHQARMSSLCVKPRGTSSPLTVSLWAQVLKYLTKPFLHCTLLAMTPQCSLSPCQSQREVSLSLMFRPDLCCCRGG